MSDKSVYGSYVEELRGFIRGWLRDHPEKMGDGRDLGSLELCRILHLELWNASQPDADPQEAIDDWNARCPHFPWIPIISKQEQYER